MNFDPTPLALLPGLALALLAAPAPAAPPTATQQVTPPPGTVLIQGGRTKLGTDVKALEKLLEDNISLRGLVNSLASETPQFTENVPSFFLMVNTVTNEQYKAFVDATGYRPPHTWGGAAVEAGRQAYLEEEGRRRRELQAAGQPLPDRVPFDADIWWRRNWQDKAWEMPAAIALDPVTFVDYQDALAYARWAGLRLPTEFEHQRAVRANTDRDYPWGPNWEGDRAPTSELRVAQPFAIASFPGGQSEDGVFDLAGNVWEWTASPFLPYPGHKNLRLKVGRGRDRTELNAVARFDADRRVTVGGSIQNEPFAARCTTRRATSRDQSTSALGFRCAGSVEIGWDIASTVLNERVPTTIRPTDVNGPVQYAPKASLAMDRWTFRDGSDHSKSLSLQGGPGRGNAEARSTSLPPQYAVITGYEHVVFVPAESLYATGPNEVRDTSLLTGPVHIGILSTTLPTLEPVLAPGTYLVAIRGAGEPPAQRPSRGAQAPPAEGETPPEGATPANVPIHELLPGIDLKKDNFIFYDMSGTPVAAHPIRGLDWGNITPSTSAVVQLPDFEMQGEKRVQISRTWYEQRLFLPGRGGRQGLKLTLPLRFEDGVLEGAWRRSR